ncbi:MAG TPA: hypothetical protein VGI74_15990 [Streptosporangiaceae bacterium]|jgi:hypothetical protein
MTAKRGGGPWQDGEGEILTAVRVVLHWSSPAGDGRRAAGSGGRLRGRPPRRVRRRPGGHQGSALVSPLNQIPASAFQAVNESCVMVSPNSGQAKAKPGCPIG